MNILEIILYRDSAKSLLDKNYNFIKVIFLNNGKDKNNQFQEGTCCLQNRINGNKLVMVDK